MNIIVLGCGRMGAELAYRLAGRGHKVTVVDQSESAFLNLPVDFKGRTVVGGALNQDVLRRAGLPEADGLAAVTNSDSVNAVVAHLARTVYKIKNVVVRSYDWRWRSMHEAFGLQTVSSASWGAQRIEELLEQQGLREVYSAGNGEVEIFEFSVPEKWAGRALREVLPAQGCVVAAVTRAGRAMLPPMDYVLEPGDIILVSATLEGTMALRTKLELPG